MDYIQDVSVPTVGRKVYFLGKVYFSARRGGVVRPLPDCFVPPWVPAWSTHLLTHALVIKLSRGDISVDDDRPVRVMLVAADWRPAFSTERQNGGAERVEKSTDDNACWSLEWVLPCLFHDRPHACPGRCRIGPIHFLAGWRKWWPERGFSFVRFSYICVASTSPVTG